MHGAPSNGIEMLRDPTQNKVRVYILYLYYPKSSCNVVGTRILKRRTRSRSIAGSFASCSFNPRTAIEAVHGTSSK